MELSSEKLVERVDSYPRNDIVCAEVRGGGWIVCKVNRQELADLLQIWRQTRISFTSHLNVEYEQPHPPLGKTEHYFRELLKSLQ